MQRIFNIATSVSDAAEIELSARKTVLGGKAASLVEMTDIGLNVPPAFCLTTKVCNDFHSELSEAGQDAFMDILMQDVVLHDNWLTETMGHEPLVSVRSGAPVSMPGMMDTILNVGLSRSNIDVWAAKLGHRAAWDSYRRLIQMMGCTAFNIDHDMFEFQLSGVKAKAGVKLDSELDTSQLITVVERYETVFKNATDMEFPSKRHTQMRYAIQAVFASWNNERAITYRKLNKIDDDMGTAVAVQSMVFGNTGPMSGSGVAFTRNPSNGDAFPLAEYLPDAQGEDVVAGIRTPLRMEGIVIIPVDGGQWMPSWASDLQAVYQRLEDHYRDMVDLEFTVQDDVLYILQSRVGKRSAQAAFKIATDMVAEGKITKIEALNRLTRDQFKTMRRPAVDPAYKQAADFTGLPACPGVVTAKPVFSAQEALDSKEPCILVTHETDPDDIAGMDAAKGILTMTGGATSHAAVVARAMDKPCITGCTELDMERLKAAPSDYKITICGATGRVWLDIDVPVIDGSESYEVRTVTEWCMQHLGVAEQVPADKEADHAFRIVAGFWWGDHEVALAVLNSLTDLPTEARNGVVIDVTPPHTTEDNLLRCFGQVDDGDDKFGVFLHQEIKKAAHKLEGIVIVGDVIPGFPTPKLPTSIGDLSDGGVIDVRPEFVETFFGGWPMFNRVVKLLKQDGEQISLLPRAVPAEYAAFTVLAP